jgi:hypothetical protein
MCTSAMGIAGGLWRAETGVTPLRFLLQSRPVDGHSVPAGALHALFPTAARRQFSSGPRGSGGRPRSSSRRSTLADVCPRSGRIATCASFSAHGPITCLVSKRRVLIRPHQRHPQRYRSRSGKPDLEPDYGMGASRDFARSGVGISWLNQFIGNLWGVSPGVLIRRNRFLPVLTGAA